MWNSSQIEKDWRKRVRFYLLISSTGVLRECDGGRFYDGSFVVSREAA